MQPSDFAVRRLISIDGLRPFLLYYKCCGAKSDAKSTAFFVLVDAYRISIDGFCSTAGYCT